MSTYLEKSDSFILAKEICNVIKVQKIRKNSKYLPYIIELVISYHNKNPKISRENCTWNCLKLDENSWQGWYDGTLCPSCGYVRGMNG